MLIDHLNAVFPMYFPSYFRIIGRVSFPIFVYMIADGCRHTRNMPKYLLRLGIFALVSQIPFDLAFNQSSYGPLQFSFIHDTNVFYTLFLGAVCVYILQKLREIENRFALPLALVPLAGAAWLASWIITDYAGFGVVFIFLMYVIPQKTLRLWVMALWIMYRYNSVLLGGIEKAFDLPWLNDNYRFYFTATGLWMLAGCLLSVPLVALYNGRRGPGMKWLFYVFYPLHLLILGGIWVMVVRPGLLG